VLHKTLDVLEVLRKEPAGMPLSDLATTVDLPKPTVYRIVATLESRGYLDRGRKGDYRLARKLFERQSDDSMEQALIRAARPAMERLVAACKETVNLGVLDGGEVLVVETLESPLPVRMSSKIGNRRYLHSTALGKVLLAGMSHSEMVRLIRLKGLPRFTEKTITSEAELVVEIEKVRQQGYAIDNQENEPDGRCIAAAITAAHNRVVAALSISGPLPRMSMGRARSFLKDLCQACNLISEVLGRAPLHPGALQPVSNGALLHCGE
jgi:DNA-binding IclR family transcriptional regulator